MHHNKLNMKRILSISIITSILAVSVEAQDLSLVTPQGRVVEVEVITPHAIKVTNMAPGEKTLTANGFDTNAVPVKVSKFELGKSILLGIGNITVAYNKNTGALTIYGGRERAVRDHGVRNIAGQRKELRLSTTSSGAFYGAGERGHSLNLRGDTLVMYNRPTYGYGGNDPRIKQMNITMPLFISSDGFAIVFDDYASAELILNNPIKYITESPGAITYYYINGVSTIADVVEHLTEITGRQDLPPLWALGYITSKYGYRTQQETEDVIDRLKRDNYPVDGIVLDLYWYGKEEDMGRLDWEPQQWPDPKKMLSDLNKKGVKVVPITQPYVLRNGKGIKNYNALAPKGAFVMDSLGNPLDVEIWVGKGGMFDMSNPDTRAWLAKRYSKLTDMGVGGWWGDLGEPEQHPHSSLHHNGLKGYEYHNRYGNDWSKIIYDLFKKKYPDRRLFTLMRGGTTGLQQYSVFPWSGDVARSWDGLEPQIRIMLNSGLSGLGYMSHDVGGFAVDEANPIDPELYVRWLQLGVFSPVLRTHSQQYAEPFNYPEHENIIKELINMRYHWLPYNYTLAYENATKGWPLVRPLNFHDEGPAYCDTIHDKFLWGHDVFVAPILKQGATSRKIVFPCGRWIDMSNPRTSYTGTLDHYSAPLEKIPLFVRAGAFIPMAEYKMANTSDYNPGKLTINYYPYKGIKSSYTLYDDDRLSPKTLKNGKYRLIQFDGDCNDSGDMSIRIISTGTYAKAPKSIEFDFKINGLDNDPGTVIVNNEKLHGAYDQTTGVFSFILNYTPGQEMNITIKNNDKI